MPGLHSVCRTAASACVQAERDDFDDELAQRIFESSGRELSEALLRTTRLLVDLGGRLVPSNAGIILFGRDRAKHYLEDARWRCIRYPGQTKSTEAFDAEEFETMTLLEALPEVERYITRNGGNQRDIQGLARSETPAFSEGVLREVLVNAVAHANYEVSGSKFDVSLYSDRLVIQSPGVWPPAYSFEDLRDGVSQIRNRAICKTLRILNFMEEQGTAWARVQEAVADGYPEPDWEPRGSVLRVSIPKHPLVSASQVEKTEKTEKTRGRQQASTAARHERIVDLLRQRLPDDMSTDELARLVSVSPATIYRDLTLLREEGLIRSTGRARVSAGGTARDE